MLELWLRRMVVRAVFTAAVVISTMTPKTTGAAQETHIPPLVVPDRGPGFYLQNIVDTFPFVVDGLGMTWPFVVNPFFQATAAAVTELILTCHIVTDEQRAAWEAYSVENNNNGVGTVSPVIFADDDASGLPTAVPTGTGPYCPFWTGLEMSLVNLDAYSLPEVAQATKRGSVANVTIDGIRAPYAGSSSTLNVYAPDIMVSSSWLIYPILSHSTNDGDNGGVVGYVLGLIPDPTLYDLAYIYLVEYVLDLMLGETYATWARETNQVFPFVTSPLFAMLAKKCIAYAPNPANVAPNDRFPLTVDRIATCVFVTSDLVSAWEAFVQFEVETWLAPDSSDEVTPFIFRVDGTGNRVPTVSHNDAAMAVYCPVWQNEPNTDAARWVNFDIFSIISVLAVQLHFANNPSWLEMTVNHVLLGPNPRRILLSPVWGQGSASPVVGSLVGLTVAVVQEEQSTASPMTIFPTKSPSNAESPTIPPTPLFISPVVATSDPTEAPAPPTDTPNAGPLLLPSAPPSTRTPTILPTTIPIESTTVSPNTLPTLLPTTERAEPSLAPTATPQPGGTALPTTAPITTASPNGSPVVTALPTGEPGMAPSADPMATPTEMPLMANGTQPSWKPTGPVRETISMLPSDRPTMSQMPTSQMPIVNPSATDFPSHNLSAGHQTKIPVLNNNTTLTPSSQPSIGNQSGTDTPSNTTISAVPTTPPSLSPSAAPNQTEIDDTPTATPSGSGAIAVSTVLFCCTAFALLQPY